MAIIIGGEPVRDLRNVAYEGRTMHDMNLEARTNMADILVQNIQASKVSGRVFAGIYPDMTQVENDICSWF
jgi:hypothetical protein